MHTKAKTRLMIIWLILAFVLLCALSITYIFAEQNQTVLNLGIQFTSHNSKKGVELEDIFTFTEVVGDDNISYYTIKVTDKTVKGSIVVPQTYNNKAVKVIEDNAFSGLSNIEQIIIQDGVTQIGECAFSCSFSKGSLTLPDIVISIDNKAFKDCKYLNTIIMNNGNEKYKCVNNCLIDIDNKILLRGGKDSIIPSDGSVTSIGEYAFCRSDITTVEIPSSIISVGSNAFYGCGSLKSATINEGVQNIGDSAFQLCTDLTAIEIPNSVNNIGSYVFKQCLYLEKAVIGNGVTTISVQAFYDCVSLSDVTIGTGVTTIKIAAFGECQGGIEDGMHGLTSITIPSNVTTIYPNVFYHCNELTSVTFEHYGWQVADSLEEDRGDDPILNVSKLKDEETAAKYLTSTYIEKYWFKW